MSKISRREFVETTGAGLVVATSVPLIVQEAHAQEAAPSTPRTSIQLVVNGTEHRAEVEDRWTLVRGASRSPGTHRHENWLRSR